MENIIKKAIEGGWGNIGKAGVTRIDCASANIDGRFYIHFFENESDMFSYNTFQILCDPFFWQCLGKACGWYTFPEEKSPRWQITALRFHEINLTEGWDKAVEWLNDLIK